MSSTPEDRELEEYLSGQSELSRRYRSLPAEEPPAAVDQAILAQARAAVETPVSSVERLTRKRSARWVVPFALAATVVLTFSFVHRAGIDTGLTSHESSAPVAAMAPQDLEPSAEKSVMYDTLPKGTNAPSAPAIAPLPSMTTEPVEQRKLRAEREDASSVADVSAMESLAREAPKEEKAMRPAAPPAAAAPVAAYGAARAVMKTTSRITAEEKQKKDAAEPELRSPELWLESIRKLRTEGKQVEAEAELESFLKVHPDYFEKNPDVVKP